mmetsp:Transcript_59750/g.129438  ORF Transcript_59750/g.129438 Transcript_59750/m.129438 type:complete len:289 (+) Transcript_59750:147-1013(+)
MRRGSGSRTSASLCWSEGRPWRRWRPSCRARVKTERSEWRRHGSWRAACRSSAMRTSSASLSSLASATRPQSERRPRGSKTRSSSFQQPRRLVLRRRLRHAKRPSSGKSSRCSRKEDESRRSWPASDGIAWRRRSARHRLRRSGKTVQASCVRSSTNSIYLRQTVGCLRRSRIRWRLFELVSRSASGTSAHLMRSFWRGRLIAMRARPAAFLSSVVERRRSRSQRRGSRPSWPGRKRANSSGDVCSRGKGNWAAPICGSAAWRAPCSRQVARDPTSLQRRTSAKCVLG